MANPIKQKNRKKKPLQKKKTGEVIGVKDFQK